MDWLKDKKNQPIVIGVFSLLIVAAVVFLIMNITGGSNGTATTDPGMPQDPNMTAMNTTPQPGAAPTTPADAGAPVSAPQPSAAPAAPAPGSAVAKIGPMESYRDDPFKPVGYKKPPKQVKKIPYILDLPIPNLPRPVINKDKPAVAPEPTQPTRRMAGLLLNGRVYAIIDTNGRTQVVQPGDTLNDGLAVVDRIERDKVILRTTRSATPRYVTVRMAAAPRTDAANANAGVPTAPAGYPGGIRPPAGYPGGPPLPGRL